MRKIRLDILRQENQASKSYVQSFFYEYEKGQGETVATALTRLNEQSDLRDINDQSARPIRWVCSCLQKKCGACAMVIDGKPRLACDSRLDQLRRTVRVEPLKKFPVVADLIVDRAILYDNLERLNVWLTAPAEQTETQSSFTYEASRCLQCGCCLEVCPNFYPDGIFTGMASAIPIARLLTELPEEQRETLSHAYQTHIYAGCGKSLACRTICPADIDIDRLLANSNAIAVWKRLSRQRKGRL